VLGFALSAAKWIGEGLLGYFQHKRELAKTKQEAEIRWASEMAAASGKSWKDEYVTVLFTLPFALAIFGYTEPLVRMFDIMAQAPQWFTMVILTIVGGSFGVQLYDKVQSVRMKHNGVKNNSADTLPPMKDERG